MTCWDAIIKVLECGERGKDCVYKAGYLQRCARGVKIARSLAHHAPDYLVYIGYYVIPG